MSKKSDSGKSKLKNIQPNIPKIKVDVINFSNYYALGRASYLLRDWIKGNSELPIPRKTLDSVFIDENNGKQIKDQMEIDENLQRKFLDDILENMIEASRSNYVANRLPAQYIKQSCFRKLADYFNTHDLDIQTEVTETNMPYIKDIAQLFDCSEKVAKCISYKEIEEMRKYILNLQESKKDEFCDCCIKIYISEDLKSHKKSGFVKDFAKKYNSTGKLIHK